MPIKGNVKAQSEMVGLLCFIAVDPMKGSGKENHDDEAQLSDGEYELPTSDGMVFIR